MNIPKKHLSVRVPWHDSNWNGKICSNPRDNGSCMFLQRINETKNLDIEEKNAEKWIHELPLNELPPCISEKVSFMSPNDIDKKVSHPYSGNSNNDKYYKHYKETILTYPAFSFSIIPYNWMLKDKKTNKSQIAIDLGLDYDSNREPNLGFENTWIQQIDNQKVILDTFVKPIIAGSSLVFIYAKNIPFIDTSERILIGVGHISKVGTLTEYDYDDNLPITFRSTLWERPIFHTIREDNKNGFLLPYQELVSLVEKDDSISIEEYIAFAPSFDEFSYGSEWVSNDNAIESLLILQGKLKKFEELLPNKNYERQFKWIDNELSRLWKMRGPFPGLGAVLSGIKVEQGNLLAWELDAIIRDNENEVEKNPWDYIDLLFNDDNSFLPNHFKPNISKTLKDTWKTYSNEEKEFLQLLSRMNLDNEQVKTIIDTKENQQIAYLKNPYLLYEKSRLNLIQIPISTIDKAIFSGKNILDKFPLSKLTDINEPINEKRIRAFSVSILEHTASNGNTLSTDSQLVTKLNDLPYEPLCNPSIRNLKAIEDFLSKEITIHVLDEKEDILYFKLCRFDEIRNKIKNFVQKRIKRELTPKLEEDWFGIIEKKFKSSDTNPEWFKEKDKKAKQEKANALQILSNNRISVLIGPAGTGKTTLLQIFRELPFIKNGTILQLAPTGKARVNMGKDAMTLAQFLIQAKRYNPETGRYFMNPNAEQSKFDTVILDEASMLTEEQLSALLDSLSGIKRFILVGDYRQLPPIGSGRPFVDIHNYLTKEQKGVSELTVLFRQGGEDNITETEKDRVDVRLAKWFSDSQIKKQEIDIFDEIANNKNTDSDNIKFIEWHNVKHLEEIIIDVANQEIEKLLYKTGKQKGNPIANFDASLGSTLHYEGSNWSGFGIESANDIENWQILSPLRNLGYGTKVINHKIQKTFRKKTIEKAKFPGSFESKGKTFYNKRKMPKPITEDGIVYGDKVINVKNIRRNQPWHKTYNPKKIEELKYIANGEIGILIGKYGDWKYDSPRPINIAFSSQKGYAYNFNSSEFKEDGDVQMELAYSITIHKSQGSGFNVVFFILPNPCPILSRELFYTALTRQKDRIIILHQGDFKDFRKFTKGEYSETGRRLTDLFIEPTLKLINKKYYDTKYIQVSEKGEFMISKSEVIIADKLHNNNIPYVYEASLTDDRKITIHPDFTIEDDDTGITYYWEHLGLLVKDDYRSSWKRKQEWYKRNGIVDYKENSDADKQLITTRDKPDGGIDSLEIKKLIDKLFG